MRASPSSADKIHHAPRRADDLADESAADMAVEQHRPRIANSSSASALRALREHMVKKIPCCLSKWQPCLAGAWLMYVCVIAACRQPRCPQQYGRGCLRAAGEILATWNVSRLRGLGHVLSPGVMSDNAMGCKLSLDHLGTWPCISATGASEMTAGETRPKLTFCPSMPTCYVPQLASLDVARGEALASQRVLRQRSASYTQAAVTDRTTCLTGVNPRWRCMAA